MIPESHPLQQLVSGSGWTPLRRRDRYSRSADRCLRLSSAGGVLRSRSATERCATPAIVRYRTSARCCSNPIRSTVLRLRSTASARCANTSATTPCSFAGMFPESINHFRLRRQRLENFVEWVKAGKESYYIVSKFEHFEYAKGRAPLRQSLEEF
jgi:hypothetical protein